MMACQTIPTPESFAPGMIGFLDCQAQAIGAAGYQALAAPGSVASILLAGMITLLIAIVGYRMLLGHVPDVREAVLTFVRIGLVLVLATSWPAFQILIYDMVLRAPAEFMAAIGGSAGLPGAGGGLVARLDGIDQALTSLAIQGVGAPPLGPDGTAMMPAVAPAPFLGFDSFALGIARVGFLVGAVGSFAVLRLAAGLLLALGPLFAGFLLFDGTRGLFEGWLKALIGIALAALATAVVLSVELALLEPWLTTLLTRRAEGGDIIGVPGQLLATMIIFGIALAGVTLILGRVAVGLRLPAWSPFREGAASQYARAVPEAMPAGLRSDVPTGERSRAATIIDAIATTQRREDRGYDGLSRAQTIAVFQRERGTRDDAGLPSGRDLPTGSSRRSSRRVSARAGIRDRR